MAHHRNVNGQNNFFIETIMDTINWGIIGCGNVTEIKSGQALNKIDGSKLIAVMRRDILKAADYAKRHTVGTTIKSESKCP